ncbi:MAG: VCBS repeat-containing protein [Candidatus Gracilibacteria bacterium]|nr:VCBS repeat-containing protein [Candidatus Gracilibacteria bacterium]MDD2908831.1 VCBS repeat-containing protein [Candidatus Gracilibacteria bacterium]
MNTFQIPLLEQTKAESASNTQIVSIIVNEKVYGSISSKLKRYAADIQAKLNNTKALIYKVPDDITPQKIAALNEKLFYEGDSVGGVSNKNSRLVGTILVGDIPLPVIHNNEKTFLSIYPYIDFNQKNFIYNYKTGFYEVSSENMNDTNPDIWHSVIAPNTGDDNKDRIKLNEFFDKDHDYYENQGIYSSSQTEQEPYVFYYDGKRDAESSSYSLWKGYELYIQNIEDLAYNRYNKYLAKKLSDLFYGNTQDETSNLFKDAGAANPDLLAYVNSNLSNSSPDTSSVPDVMTKQIITAVTKQFFQVFNEKYIGDILKFAYNTGRYGNTNSTRVDTVISTISKKDNLMKRLLKDTNTSMEGIVDNILKKGLARNIALPIKVEESKHHIYEIDNGEGSWSCDGRDLAAYDQFGSSGVGTLENFYYGKIGSSLIKTNECSIYRGSSRTSDNKSLLVESTRVQNLSEARTTEDTTLLQNSPSAAKCFPAGTPQTMSFWGGYSIFNIDQAALASGDTNGNLLPLKATDYRRATKPIFDIVGGSQIGYDKTSDNQIIKKDVAGNDIKTVSPKDCLDFNWLYTGPDNLANEKSSCISNYSNHESKYAFEPYSGNTFEELFKNIDSGKIYFNDGKGSTYQNRYIFLDGQKVKEKVENADQCLTNSQYITYSKYYFKKIYGVVEHKSPTDEEYGAQLKNMTTPSLPVDRNRYVDFVSAKGNQKNFEYPNLFRIIISNPKELTYEGAKSKLKTYLDKKSQELNAIINSENPSGLSGSDLEIYNKLKTGGSYPTAINFFETLSNNPKIIDEVIKNVLWQNLNSIELKYQYVFEHNLDIDGNSPSVDAGHRSDYEVVYLGGKGDSNNMFIKLDPEKSKEDKGAALDIKNKFLAFKSALDASKISKDSTANPKTEFKCGPPDGVPIFEWMSAIMCRLKTLVPPVSVQAGKCSSNSSSSSDLGQTNFGGELETITNPIYLEDKDQNQIPDGAELIDYNKGGDIEIISDRGMYGYNKSIRIKANLLNYGKLIAVDSSSKVNFDVEEIIAYSGSQYNTVYNKTGNQESIRNRNNINAYINFAPISIKANKGVADYAFSSKSSDVDVIIRASISTKDKNGKIAVSNESEDFVVRIRGISISISSKVYFKNNSTSSTSSIDAGEVNKIEFSLKTIDKNNKPFENNFTPFKLDLINSITGEKILSGVTVESSSYSYNGEILKKTGNYKFNFTDVEGIEGTQNLTVNPGKIGEIRLTSSSTQFVKGSEVDVFAELFDNNNNRATGELFNVKGEISGNGVFEDGNSKSITRGLLEGYSNFRVKSDGNPGTITIKFSVENTNISKEIKLESIESAKIKLNIENSNNIIAGGNKHKISISVIENNENNKLLDKFNGVAYFDFPELNGVIVNNFVKIKNGKSEEDVYLFPGIVASKNIKINASVPGVDKIEGNIISVLPDKPMYVGLVNSNPKLEAKAGEKTTIKAALYDRYGNITYNDSSHSIKFQIPEEYQKYAELSGGKYIQSEVATSGIAKIDVFATDIPGSAYIIAEATSPLENNSFVVKDEAGGEITIKGMSQNVTTLDSYYLFNKSKLDNIDYNGLYSVLQGADYGNLTHPGYLAGEILFNKGGRSLAVSSVLNNPYFREIAFGFTPGGKFIANSEGSKDQSFSLEPEISTTTQGTAINLYDSVYKDLIARAWLNFDNNAELIDCSTNDDINLSKCSIPQNKTFIVLKGIGLVTTQKEGDSISIMLNNFKVFTIDNKGKIIKDPGVSLELDSNAIGNMLGVKIVMNKENIGYFGLKFNTNSVTVKDSEEFPNILASNKNQIVIEHISPDYYFDNSYLGVSSHGARGIMFYKLDNSNESIDKDLVTRGEKTGLENYTEEAGIGWGGKNKMLLEFAGGNNIGDSTKFYQTYSMINLGDPVIKLNTQKAKDSDFDKSIGKRILEEKSSPIENYKKLDFNGDNVDDLVAFYENGNIELLANYEGNLKNMGNLAYISDAGKGRKGVGDFSGDNYDDIIFADSKGKIGFLQNVLAKFSRINPIILDVNTKKETQINGAIQQMEVFDMDNDGKSDIVIVDDSGELSILYGSSDKSDKKQIFYKKILDDSLGMTLSSKDTKSGGAIFFDGIPQILASNDQGKYLLDAQKLALSDGNDTETTLKAQLDKLIYYQEKYSESGTGTVTQAQREEVINATVGTDENGNPNGAVAAEIIQAQKDLLVLNGSGMTNISAINTQAIEKTKTFIRSQFAEAYKVSVDKTYTDINGKFLQSGDLVEVTLKIANNSGKKLTNLVYFDSNQNFLQSDDNAVYTLTTKDGTTNSPLKKKDDTEFDLIFDNFDINSGDTAIIKYKLKMPNVSFGKITVGALKSDDKYGDVALSPSNQCGANQLMWYSSSVRTYNKGLQQFEDKSKMPDVIEKNKIDENNNGTPDYIDELQKDQSKMRDYANEQLSDLNKDSNHNGIPDKDEDNGGSIFDYDGSNGEISVGGLNSFNFDEIDSQIDDVVNGLGCGFGGGACISMPLNWAPLAPGSSPTIFGMPVSSSLMAPSSGLPIFSLLTGLPTPFGCLPVVWPLSPIKFEPPLCGGALTPSSPPGPPFSITPKIPLGAGGMLGTDSVTNFLRIYVTPTITGAVGTAICFGGPAGTMGKLPPKGVSPLVPGGNCIIAAKPLVGCSDDGSDGNVSSQGIINTSSANNGNSNKFFNASSCTSPQDVKGSLSPGITADIISYMKGDTSKAKTILNDPAVQHGGIDPDNGPMIGMSTPWGTDGESLDINIDPNALANLDVSNIVKINYSRVSAFPDFIMDWVTRQLEEILNKLTTLPTIYIILPDFSGIADSSWTDFGKKITDTYDKIKKEDEKEATKNKIAEQEQLNKLKTDTSKSWQSATNEGKELLKNLSPIPKEGISGVKAAYELIGNLPLISIQNETIDINIPWIASEDIDKWIIDAKGKKEQYQTTISNTHQKWKDLAHDPSTAVGFKLLLDADKLVNSIDANINTLEEYKAFPTKLRKYIQWKEHFISQILCNIEIINKVTGERIYTNGKRFKAWVEMIVLLKAILKSWQAIVDIFIDFNASCSVCHNERYNLVYWIVKLVSSLIPKLSIIQFPKWPDIIIDLHNIRAGLNIIMPEFNFKVVPMVLPQLPKLYLPDTPKIEIAGKISLPEIPTLPSLPDLPDLPDLPSLPDVKLPDLPPPPKIPNIFGVISAAISLLKLIAKVLCLRRQIGNLLPPEWKAGDSIAWMTERNGTLPMDKLFIDFPEFSMSFVDAIKVTSYVNLEFDVEFIVEMAKSTLEPFNQFSNDMSNMSGGFKIPNVDLKSLAPSDVNINVDVKVDKDGTNIEGYNGVNSNKNLLSYIGALTGFTIGGIFQVVKGIQENTKEYELADFKKSLKKDIQKIAISTNPKEQKIYDIMSRAITFDASSENSFIEGLAKNNKDKFSALKNILNQSQKENDKLNVELSKIENGQKSIKDFSPIKMNNYGGLKIIGNYSNKNDLTTKLNEKNSYIFNSLDNLSNNEKDKDSEELKNGGDEILDQVKLGIKSLKAEALEGITPESGNNVVDKNLATSSTTSSASSSLDYSFNYEGIYIINSSGKQSRLFDYLDEVNKDSNVVELDFDKDGDTDVIYKMGEALYLKENLTKKPSINHISSVDGMRDIGDINDYLGIDNENDNIPLAPNFFEEVIASSNSINFKFSPANPDKQNSFRLEYYDYIDRFDRTNNKKTNNISVNPYSQLNFVDMVTTMSDEYIIDTPKGLIQKNNFATLDSGLGDNVDITGVDYGIAEEGKSLIVQEGKTIYVGEAGARIEYKFNGDTTYKTISLDKKTNIEFLETANVNIVSGSLILVYGTKKEYTGDINTLRGMPILPGTIFNFKNNNQKAVIKYVGGGELIIDNGSSYRMINIGEKSDSYSVGFNVPNSFYYGKLYEFSNNKRSTITDLALMSPQSESDSESPLVSLNDGIKIPVYQKQTINFKKYINDVSGIKEIYIDFDINKDTSGDGIVDNDKDSLDSDSPYYNLVHKGSTIYDLVVGPFDSIFNKKVMLYVVDENNNVSKNPVDFEVYAPIPTIVSTDSGIIKGLINEELNGEPIDIFRYRNGILDLIKPKVGSVTKTNELGQFGIEVESTSSGIVIKKTRAENELEAGFKETIIANVNETTGKIDLKDTDNYSLKVIGASNDKKTTIQLVSKSKGNIIYEQSFNLSANQVIQSVDSFDNLSKGMYFKSNKEGYKLINNSSKVPSLSAGAFIIDSEFKAIAGIGQDGNIYVVNDKYKLTYENNGDNVVINIVDSTSNIVGKLLFKVNLEFIIK